jgi:hypothetical protein
MLFSNCGENQPNSFRTPVKFLQRRISRLTGEVRSILAGTRSLLVCTSFVLKFVGRVFQLAAHHSRLLGGFDRHGNSFDLRESPEIYV